MDPRRFLIPLAVSLMLSGCALFRPAGSDPRLPDPAASAALDAAPDDAATASLTGDNPPPAAMELLRPAVSSTPSPTERPYLTGASDPAIPQPLERPAAVPVTRPSPASGREAIAAANQAARAASRSDGFVGGVQVFGWSPGRVFEVWTAPLRVTTLSLAPGETLLAKAAGDTVRWQIGEALSGAGAEARTHVLLKPLERGLETNLILTTNRRVYLIDLKSGPVGSFNAAVAWDAPDPVIDPPVTASLQEARVPDPVVSPQGPLDGRYRIEPQGRRARWTPTSVFNDGVRTFITFDPDLQVDEAPALFLIAPDGEAQMVNYRQVGGLFVVDRVFDRAELRLGDRRPQIVRIRHLPGDRS